MASTRDRDRGRQSHRRILAAICGAFLALASAGCTPSPSPPVLTVSPTVMRMDEPLSFTVTNAEKDSPATVALRAVDAAGITWVSEATFTADDRGTVDPASNAPTAGSYVGVWPGGLLSTMHPETAGSAVFRWPTAGPATFDLTARSGDQTSGTVAVARTLWPEAPTVRTFTLAENGFVGTYYRPAGVRRGPAVMVLGGSEGGNPAGSAAILAARGIPALSVAYFNAPGLPRNLANIPLEYFHRPLRWLRRQPEVEPARLWVSGASRGSEAAALIAVDNPTTVHGLLDLSPSSTVNCSYIPSTHLQCPKPPAWLRNGKPVPSTSEWSNPGPADVPAAIIPVEEITGPVLTLCGGSDLLWSSCEYSEAIQHRLQTKGVRYPRVQLSYPDAGHGIDFPAPDIPAIETTSSEQLHGTTPGANELARADAWPKILQFIDTPS